mgnify:CR=1 FL=1
MLKMISPVLGLALVLFAAAAALLAWKRRSGRKRMEALAYQKMQREAERAYQAHLAQLCWNYRAKRTRHARRPGPGPDFYPKVS